MKPINLGLLGVGTVGSGTVKVLRDNADEIIRRTGRNLKLRIAADLDLNHARSIVGEDVELVSDGAQVVAHPEVDIVIELIGGTGIAKTLVLQAIANGKHVVTANKKLLAEHGNEIFALAQKHGVMVAFEAAVAGGIPVIKALREGMAANHIEWLAGIINGTSNFILTEMRDKGVSFADALADAQRLGYAELDPTFDIEGNDAGHKLTIMAAIAFGIPMCLADCYLEGISNLSACDIRYAEELGYRVKLLGLARRSEQGVELRVHPTLIPANLLLANVNGVMNAVLVKGDAVGATLFYGAGAGSLPTASAVVADIVDIARLHTADSAHRVPHLAFQPDKLQSLPMLSIDKVISSYYLRIKALDRAGVLVDITRLLADNGISIEAMIQKSSAADGFADVIILTHKVRESQVNLAIKSIEEQSSVTGKIVRLRMESLNA